MKRGIADNENIIIKWCWWLCNVGAEEEVVEFKSNFEEGDDWQKWNIAWHTCTQDG